MPASVPTGRLRVTERARQSVRKLSLSYFFVSLFYLMVGALLLLASDLPVGIVPSNLRQTSFVIFNQLNLYGFVAAMIFGVSYSLLPAMAAQLPLVRHPKLAWVQFWFFNAGLLGAMVGKGVQAFTTVDGLRTFTFTSSALLTFSLLLYGVVMASTLVAGTAGERGDSHAG